MDLKVDFHTHTKYSDGVYSPAELFERAKKAGLTAVGITDHDTVAGVVASYGIVADYGLELIPGIEVSCFENGREFHLLGYLIDVEAPQLQAHINIARNARYKRAKNIISKLKSLKVDLKLDDVMEKAGDAPIARPHIAYALTEHGYTVSNKQAFYLYLGDGRPAYEPKWNFPVHEGIKLINSSGGIAVIAHPGPYFPQDALFDMIDKGLDGIECVHPYHNETTKKHYMSLANQYWLLETGGSDFHGGREFDEENLGKFSVPYSWYEAVKRRAMY